MKLDTLRKRREFLRVRGGGRWATDAFVLETKQRPDQPAERPRQVVQQPHHGPRFGFTVTKRLGNAVRRNRIRRRLKAAVGEVAHGAARDHFDYVVIARAPAHDMTFAELTDRLVQAFARVHRPRGKSHAPRRKHSDNDTMKPKTRTQAADKGKFNLRP